MTIRPAARTPTELMPSRQTTVTIGHRRADLIDATTRQRLLELTLPGGDMASVFRACANPTSTAWSGTVITASVDGGIVGWALRWRCTPNTAWSVHLFVAPAWRRLGIGTRLVDAARHRLQRSTRLRGFGWDDQSTAFWVSVGTMSTSVGRPDRLSSLKPVGVDAGQLPSSGASVTLTTPAATASRRQ